MRTVAGTGKGKIFCCYCGKWLVPPLKWNIEHLVPVSKGGNNSAVNRTPCCTRCNTWRCNKPLENWRNEVQKLINQNQCLAPFYHVYDLEIIVMNIDYWIEYVNSAGFKLYRKDHPEWVKRYVTKC